MATRRGTLTGNFTNNGAVIGTGITLAANETITQINSCSSNVTMAGTTNSNATGHLWFCESSGTEVSANQIIQLTSQNKGTKYFLGPNATSTHSKALSISGLAGKAVYMKLRVTTGSATVAGGSGASIVITTNLSVTACGAPTSVTIARDGANKLKVSWSGATAGTNNSIKSYTVVLSTSSGGSAAFSASTTATSYTFTTNNATAYFAGVKAISSIGYDYDSGYKWSSSSLGAATACSAPTSVTLAQDGNGKLKVSWSGAAGGNNNAINKYSVYLSASSGGGVAYIGSTALHTYVTSTATSGSYTFTVNNQNTYYAAVCTMGAAGDGYYSAYKWSSGQAAWYKTNCTAPTSVSVSRVRGTVTITWSGQSGGTNNPITSYTVLRNTSASESGATTVSSSGSSGMTNAPGAGTFCYGVRSVSSFNTTGYKWSGSITVPSKPSVSAGTTITDTQMDNLRTWINTSGITDIADGAQVKATEGNTYRNTLTAGTSKVEASWYNTAAG